MELLDVLNGKIMDLLAERDVLRARNRELENHLNLAKETEAKGSVGHTAELIQALEQERRLRGEVLRRIDVLVRYLEEQSSAG